MEELYLKTENGNVQLNQQQIEKYQLKIGTKSPNTGYLIVGKNGEDHIETEKKKDTSKHTLDEMKKDKTIFQTSEIIDISQGVDSDQDFKV